MMWIPETNGDKPLLSQLSLSRAWGANFDLSKHCLFLRRSNLVAKSEFCEGQFFRAQKLRIHNLSVNR